MKILKFTILVIAILAGLWASSVIATHLIYWDNGYFFNPRMPGRSTLCVEGESQETANWIKDLISGPQGWGPAGYELVWPSSKLGWAQEMGVKVAGYGGLPASGVSAIALNITGTEPSTLTYLSIYPTGETRPNISNLNLGAGQTQANFAIVKVGSDGGIVIYNNQGEVHIILDVNGWFDINGIYYPVAPSRILDTRGNALRCDVTVVFTDFGDTWWAGQVWFEDVQTVDRNGRAFASNKFKVEINSRHYNKMTPWSKQLLINHEFGHVVGPLGDHPENANCGWLMSYCWTTNAPSLEELQVVRALYGVQNLPEWVEETRTDIWKGVVTGAATAFGAILFLAIGKFIWGKLSYSTTLKSIIKSLLNIRRP